MLDTKEIEELAKLFAEFPGTGDRQSKRFVYYLLRKGKTYRNILAQSISALDKNVAQCPKCFRFFSYEKSDICSICKDFQRDQKQLLVVEKDSDIGAIEKSNIYKGNYFVLGGLIPIAIEDHVKHLHLKQLLERIKTDNLEEIILAFPVHANGDYTSDYLREKISELKLELKISILGRGLSTGSDIEYTDKSTLEYALHNRK